MKYANIAQPYAKAAFSYAQQHDTIDQWLEALTNLKMIADNEQFIACRESPHFSTGQISSLLKDILGDKSPSPFANFIDIIAENNRFLAIGDIADLFARFTADKKNTRHAQVYSAIDLTKKQQENLKKALVERLDTNVELTFSTDQSLIGGATIKLDDDTVIDGSVKTKLEKLTAQLTS